MKIQRLEEVPLYRHQVPVKVTDMGNIVELQYMSNCNSECPVIMLPRNEDGQKEYILKESGEILQCKEMETRADSKQSLYRTFRNLRNIINANIIDIYKVRWITLTYAENMTDTEKLMIDFQQFNQRFQYYCKTHNLGKAEYISVCEPQGRGAWHIHLLYIWEDIAPFIANSTLAEIWGHGFVKITALDNVDNVGAYLTAYLGDIEIEVDVYTPFCCGNRH